jgi:lipid-A-disaccharide synthase
MAAPAHNGAPDREPGILFTAFEPSGDALAAPVVRAIRQIQPDRPIWALGGPRMEAAGALLIEKTTAHASMFALAATRALQHGRMLNRLRTWLADHRVASLVPVDSPAANWSICRLIRRTQPKARIIHLAAPQVWAWARWRIARLRRLTDHVLCILPFEPAWFGERGVRATFVGHPLFDAEGRRNETPTALDPAGPRGACKLALLPGSRPKEISSNWPAMLEAFGRLLAQRENLVGLIAATDEPAAQQLHQIAHRGGVRLPTDNLELRVGQTDAALRWCDLALIVSGTATLQAAAHRKPMVALFIVNRLTWHMFGRWIVRTRPLTLPNLVCADDGCGIVVPELVPHIGDVQPICTSLDELIDDADARNRQLAGLEKIAARYRGLQFDQKAAGCILQGIDAHLLNCG